MINCARIETFERIECVLDSARFGPGRFGFDRIAASVARIAREHTNLVHCSFLYVLESLLSVIEALFYNLQTNLFGDLFSK